VGFQIGGSSTDLIMLVMTERGSQKLLESKFTLGAEGSVAAGPAKLLSLLNRYSSRESTD
jgi:lipid-binding SYLF domain-containing protein